MDNLPLGVCTFEASTVCGYSTPEGTKGFKWGRASGATSSTGTGPSNDHTYKSRRGKIFVLIT